MRIMVFFLPTSIMQLAKHKFPLHESITIVKFVENKVEHILGEAGISIKEKFKKCIEKPRSLNILGKISNILIGEATSMK